MQCTGAANPGVFLWAITRRGPVIANVMPAMNPYITLTPIVSFLSLFVIAFFGGCSDSAPEDVAKSTPNLPPIEHINSITVSVDYPDYQISDFEIPESDWEELLSTMRNAPKDDNPAKWIHAGNMKIVASKGTQIHIDIYDSGKNAFSIEGDDGRIYYRSTSSNATLRAIEASISRSKKRE
jgi:hypothetical protein